jgi:hypothetical protein
MAALSATLLVVVLGLCQRGRLALITSWWQELRELAPLTAGLRTYWIITIPVTVAGLLAAVFCILRRWPKAASLATTILAMAILVNIGELVLLIGAQRQLSTAVASTLGLQPHEVGGFHAGILTSSSDLILRTLCLVFVMFSQKVRESFGPITWDWFRQRS